MCIRVTFRVNFRILANFWSGYILDLFVIERIICLFQEFFVTVETHGSNVEHDRSKLEDFVEKAMESSLVVDGVVAQDETQMRFDPTDSISHILTTMWCIDIFGRFVRRLATGILREESGCTCTMCHCPSSSIMGWWSI